VTKVKFCGVSRPCDIEAANELRPEYVGFVFATGSHRCITPEKAKELKQMLSRDILAVGVFVNEMPEKIAYLLDNGIIDIAQLHGHEDEDYIQSLRRLTNKPTIKAFRIESKKDLEAAECCIADYVLLDSGAGTGTTFDWKLIKSIRRPYFLAGGLSLDNVKEAITMLHPYAVDVSSGIETDKLKNKAKMTAFIEAVREEGQV
jgi:phosphoribosylanthranilate isomerase